MGSQFLIQLEEIRIMKVLIIVALALAAVMAEPEADAQYWYNRFYNNGYGYYNPGQGFFNRGFYGYPMMGYNRMWKRDAEAVSEADADAQYQWYGNQYYGYPMSYGYNYNRMWKRDAEPEADADAEAQYYYSKYYNSRPYGFYNNQQYGNQYYGQRWGQPQNQWYNQWRF